MDFSQLGIDNAVLEKIWARSKVEDLMSQDWDGIQYGSSQHRAEIIQVGLEHNLATQYTSFVAVEEQTVVQDGKPVRIEVPVKLPEGVSHLALQESGMVVHKMRYAASQGAYASGAISETVEVGAKDSLIHVDTVKAIPLPQNKELGRNSGMIDTSKPNRDETKHKLTEGKLSSGLLALYQCTVHRQTSTTLNGCKLADAPINVKVELSTTSPKTEQKLVYAGLKITSGAGTAQVTGTIRASQLRSLAEIAEVKSIAQINEK